MGFGGLGVETWVWAVVRGMDAMARRGTVWNTCICIAMVQLVKQEVDGYED
jgi:hypothetical protein